MPYSRTLLSITRFARFCSSSVFSWSSTTKLHLKHGPKTTYFLALVKPKRVKTCLRQGVSSGALGGRLRRGPRTSRGVAGVAASPRPPVHWSGRVCRRMTQPVYTVLARATRAQPSSFGHAMNRNEPAGKKLKICKPAHQTNII